MSSHFRMANSANVVILMLVLMLVLELVLV